jgi:hypothetical protein
MSVFLIDGLSLDECSFLTNILNGGLTKEDGEPFYKSNQEMVKECHSTIRIIKSAKSKFENLGFFKKAKRNPSKFSGST